MGLFVVVAADTAAVVDGAAARIDSLRLRSLGPRAWLSVAEARGFGLARALTFGLVTALLAAGGPPDEARGVDSTDEATLGVVAGGASGAG